MKRNIKTYSELITIPTFKERFEYLKLGGIVGSDTFGFDRYINQKFYCSKEWKAIRDEIIFRDLGCDLAMSGCEILGRVIIHHINPIEIVDIEKNSEFLLNPEFLISTTHRTHNAIHYGDERLLQNEVIERRPNDTCPWRKNNG